MNLSIECIDRSRFKPNNKDTLILFAWEGEKTDAEGWLDAKKEKILDDIAKKENFRAKSGRILIFHPLDEDPAARILLIGLGKKKDASANSPLREAMAHAIKASLKQSETIWVDIPRWPDKKSLAHLAQVITEGACLASYRYNKYKTGDRDSSKEHLLRKIILVTEKPDEMPGAKEGIKRGEIFSEAVNFVRDLVNEPPSRKRPQELAKIAKSIASSRIKVRLYAKSELEKMGMNAILGVGSGSSHDPVFVEAIYKPKVAPKKQIGLVGKGITFDSGGLNIKTGDHMTTMKLDMAGGASVLAILRACEKLEIPCEIHGFVPFVENMPGGNAYKPGDIIKAYNGKTIEVLNTDAEGRVILADALSFASTKNLDLIIDMATLTGAVTIALGDQIAGLLSNNERLSEDLRQAAKIAGENVWPLPLHAEYKERIKGKVGDVINISNKAGAGTIIGGLFLEEFVDSKPWAHFDIAGTAWADGETALCPSGGTGSMVRTILEYLSITN